MELTPEQRAAVETQARVALVYATPGSGKTRVIAERILYLLRQGVPAHSIVALTFTRMAAGDLRARVEAACKLDGRLVPRGLVCTTLHGYCRSLLPGRHVLGEQEARTLFASVMPKRVKYSEWESIEHGGIGNVDLLPYKCELEESSSMDYPSLLQEGLDELMRGCRDCHVLLDEAQDLSWTQWLIVMKMSARGSAFCVGDPSQAIYQWRYADPQAFVDLANSPAAGATVYHLAHSFRCPRDACKVANLVLPDPPSGVEVRPMPGAPKGLVSVLNGGSLSEIGWSIRNMMLPPDPADQCTPEPRWSDFAVLCRSNRTATMVAQELRGLLIPVRLIDAKQRPSPEHVFAMAALRLIRTPDHWPSLLVMLSQLECRAFVAECRYVHRTNGLEGLRETVHNRQVINEKLEVIRRCWAWSDARNKQEVTCSPVVNTILDSIGIEAPPFVYGKTLDEAIDDYEAGIEPTDDFGETYDAVTVCTVHQAKGREWPHVYLAELNAGEWPSASKTADPEERRVLYVAVTRAQESLVLHWSGEPSPLIAEVIR